MKTLVIAEAGVNHNGDMALALQLVDAAADAGADLVKFQTFVADRVVSQAAAQAEYQRRNTGRNESQHAMLRRLELTRPMHEEIIARCADRGIGFFSTAFDMPSIDLLVDLGMTTFKVPSGEITNLPYLRRIGGLGGDVLLSTGMSTLGDIEAALDALEAAGTARARITVLHCTTEYPAPMADVNLRAMTAIGRAFGVEVGYSDHTAGIEIPVAAVALGATVIEKHFTISRTLPGPDHSASLEPEELAAMVASIRNVELALGDGVKRLTEAEARNRVAARRSVVAARPIAAGERFDVGNLTTLRPGSGLSPMRWDDIVGRVAIRPFELGEAIET